MLLTVCEHARGARWGPVDRRRHRHLWGI